MGDAYDPYRDALVIEEETVWSPDGERLAPEVRLAIHRLVHAKPWLAGELFYIRVFTGFIRRIVLRPEDVERLAALVSQGTAVESSLPESTGGTQ
ncbi:MAG: hypothetical protein NZ899_03595 [Thermoguttaceae bacterium]|nr:hypothetical protein [Thermoguttaceae bacterium]MDW8078799.1 hypothetical protein [Thermoguttaceae bacterium]